MAHAGDQAHEKRNLTLIFSASAAGILLFAFLFMPGRSNEWNAMRKHVADLTAEARSRVEPRAVLRGQPSPGNAWDDYSIALQSVGSSSAGTDMMPILSKFVNRDSQADRAQAEKLIADHVDVFRYLQRGAQKTDGQYPYEWERGSNSKTPSLLASRMVALLAASQARIWTEGGRAGDSANLLLDLTVFGRDLGTNGTLLSHLIGMAVYLTALDEARHLILSGKLNREELAGFARQLELVDRDFPRLGPALLNEVLVPGAIVDWDPASARETWKLLSTSGWSYGFSVKRMAAEAVDEREGYMRRAQNFDRLPFVELATEASSIDAEVASSRNTLTRQSMPDLFKSAVSHREALTHLRLLRAGATFLATGEVPLLADPFGVTLSHSIEGGKVKIWSLGRDGKNQNGLGDWNPGAGVGDILLEIPR
jgi:hypothetical protein